MPPPMAPRLVGRWHGGGTVAGCRQCAGSPVTTSGHGLGHVAHGLGNRRSAGSGVFGRADDAVVVLVNRVELVLESGGDNGSGARSCAVLAAVHAWRHGWGGRATTL